MKGVHCALCVRHHAKHFLGIFPLYPQKKTTRWGCDPLVTVGSWAPQQLRSLPMGTMMSFDRTQACPTPKPLLSLLHCCTHFHCTVGTCLKCRISELTLVLWKQNLHFNKSPGESCMLKFDNSWSNYIMPASASSAGQRTESVTLSHHSAFSYKRWTQPTHMTTHYNCPQVSSSP